MLCHQLLQPLVNLVQAVVDRLDSNTASVSDLLNSQLHSKAVPDTILLLGGQLKNALRQHVKSLALRFVFGKQLPKNVARSIGYPGWELAGIYADDGISGTNTKKREEFNRLIDDCMAGQIDMVVTKSICIFARNTLDCLQPADRPER